MIQSLLVAMTLVGEEGQERLFQNAQIVRLMARKGEKVCAGPLTLLIDPVTHQPVKSVVVDPAKNQLIPAVYRHPGEADRVSVFLLRPMEGRSEKAVYRGNGAEMLLVIPDNLGDRDVRKRSFWSEGRKDGRRHVRQVTYYEIVAYTSRDAFAAYRCEGAGPPEKVGYSDENPDGSRTAEVVVQAEGVHVSGVSSPGRVKIGQEYEITVSIRSDGIKGRLLVKAIRDGKDVQEKETDLERRPADVTYRYVAEREPVEQVNVTYRRVEELLPEKADAKAVAESAPPVGFQDANPCYEGKPSALREGMTASRSGSGKSFFRPGILLGAGGTVLVPVAIALLADGGKEERKTLVQTSLQDGDASASEEIVLELTQGKEKLRFPPSKYRRSEKESVLEEVTTRESRTLTPEAIRER